MKPEKYEAPEVEFVEMEDEDVVTASCSYYCANGNGYGNDLCNNDVCNQYHKQ